VCRVKSRDCVLDCLPQSAIARILRFSRGRRKPQMAPVRRCDNLRHSIGDALAYSRRARSPSDLHPTHTVTVSGDVTEKDGMTMMTASDVTMVSK
jgi:hypothetical protein